MWWINLIWTIYSTEATFSNYSSYTSTGTDSSWGYGTTRTIPTWDYDSIGTQTTTGIPDYINDRIIFSEHSTGGFYDICSLYRPERSWSNQRPDPQPSQPSLPPKPDPERIAAEERARTLLLEHLDEFNKDRYVKKEPIEIPSNIWSDVRYRLPISKWEKIIALKKEKVIDRLCLTVQEPEHLPLEDVILTKMLHVLYNEIEMLRKANHYPEKDGENLLNRLT